MLKTSIQQAASDFEVFLRVERNLAPRTIKEYLDDLRAVFETLDKKFGLKNPSVDQIDKTQIKKHLELLQTERSFTSVSLARVMSSLRGFFRFCAEQEYTEANPTDGLRSPKHVKRLPIYLVESELRNLFGQPDQSEPVGIRDHAILVVLANTGMRVSELAGLTLNSLDFERGVIRVFGKGRKERLVPMNDAVRAVLANWDRVRPRPSETDAVFVGLDKGRRGKPFGVRGIQVMMKKHGLKANIPRERLTPHKLRHTFATLLHMNEVDIIEIQALLGHANISSTQIYTHTNAGRLRSAVDRLADLGNGG